MPQPPTPAERPARKPQTDKQAVREADLRVAARASREDGVLSSDELAACGLNRAAIAVRVARGGLHSVYRSVYLVGHCRLSPRRRLRAALKACGPDAVLSHFSAAMLWGLLPWSDREPHITMRRFGLRRHARIRIHQSTEVAAEHIVKHDGMVVTSLPWTIIDLAGVLPPRQLRRVVRQALATKQTTIRQLVALARANRGRRGMARLTAVLADAVPTESELEDVVLDLIVDGGLERPDVNRSLVIEGVTVRPDLRWPKQRLVVEADSRRWHDDPISRADDLKRQRLLERHGDRVERVTWTQAVRNGPATLRRLRDNGAPGNVHRTASKQA